MAAFLPQRAKLAAPVRRRERRLGEFAGVGAALAWSTRFADVSRRSVLHGALSAIADLVNA